jgi:hypothetical protein
MRQCARLWVVVLGALWSVLTHGQSTQVPNCPTGSVTVFFDDGCNQVPVAGRSAYSAPASSFPVSVVCSTAAGTTKKVTATYTGGFPGCKSPGVSACSAGAQQNAFVDVGTAATNSPSASVTHNAVGAALIAGTAQYVAMNDQCQAKVNGVVDYVGEADGGGCIVDDTKNAAGTYDVWCAYKATEDGKVVVPGGGAAQGAGDAVGDSGASDVVGDGSTPVYFPDPTGGGGGGGTGTGGDGGSGTGTGGDGGGGTGTGGDGGSGTGTGGTGTGGAGTGGSGSGGTGTGGTGTGSSSLCQDDPSAVACQSLGTASGAGTLPTSSSGVALAPVAVGGPSNPVCPLPLSVDVFGASLTFSFQPQCDFMARVRPFIVAMCGVIAAGIFVAGLKS